MMPIMAATNATNTSPRRNIVTVIRTVSPRSGAYLVRAIWHLRSCQAALSLYGGLCLALWGIYLKNTEGKLKRPAETAKRAPAVTPLANARLRMADRVAGERAVGEELTHFIDTGVRERQDVVGGHERISRHRRARPPDQAHRRAEGGAERGVVVLLDRGVQLGVEHGQ